jgi:hypothetical protein
MGAPSDPEQRFRLILGIEMKKLSLLILVLVLGMGYYIAWPAWSAYELQDAIKTRDLVALARKIDFPSVRTSLRASAVEKLAELHDRPNSLPTGAVSSERNRKDVGTPIIDQFLERAATPDSLLRIIREEGPLRTSVERLLRDHMNRAGEGAAQVKSTPVERTVGAEAPERTSSYGFANIKSIRPASPFRYEIGIAKDQAATRPDIIIDFGFTGTDWKITGVRPAPT